MSEFNYLLDKIQQSDFVQDPFRHLYIEEFFSEQHFDQIVGSPEIYGPKATTDLELIDELVRLGYRQIKFPGTANDINSYLRWRRRPNRKDIEKTCSSFGLVFRLEEVTSPIIKELNKFLLSSQFKQVIAKKFRLSDEKTNIDTGIQKYLDGYEISPHPDVRRKALTYMVNINPAKNSEELAYHTEYMQLIPEYEYIKSFWRNNVEVERDWLPWECAKTKKIQKRNNTIVIFSPNEETIHAVKADYNHFQTQRTQLYGNLWYESSTSKCDIDWRRLDLRAQARHHDSIVYRVLRRLKRKKY